MLLPLFDTVCLHALETLVVGRVHILHLHPEILHPLSQLVTVQLAVASPCFEDFRLFCLAKVFPLKVRSHMFLEQSQNLIVGDGTRVGKVVDTGVAGRGK